MSLRFGTDGVRGVAGSELTPELVLGLGRAAARVLGAAGVPLLVGRDTRWSGPLLQAAFSAGVAAEGIDVVDLGVLPTPAVAEAARRQAAPAAVISASHNPFADNGIKLLAAGGRKLTDAQEETVEAALARILSAGAGASGAPAAEGSRLGRLRSDPDALGRYCGSVGAALEGRPLDGVRVVIDCANGAAALSARRILADAGAVLVDVLADAPDGVNINAGCGSTDPGDLSVAVVAGGADVGLAFDGDADRVIAVDERGAVVDGDRLIALFASDLHRRGRLSGGAVAVTIMTNLGFHRAMAGAGIEVATTPVGDRHILEEMEARGLALGGEQSGHIIFRDPTRDLAPTGDGVLTGLLLLDLIRRRARPLSELAGAVMTRIPQVLRNVEVSDREGLEGAGQVWEQVRAVEEELGDQGRVLLRSSGTERLVRVMVEAPTDEVAARAADRLTDAVLSALGAPAGDG
jgi:phosphoglucosamine mutase